MVRLGALRRRDVERARQEVDDGVEHRLDALVLERRAAQDRHEVERQRAGAQRDLDLVLGDVFAGEVLLHQVVVAGGDGLEQLLAVLGGLLGHVGRDLDLVPLGAELLVVPDQGLHLDEVDQADERLVGLRATGADGQVDDGRGGLQAVLDHVDGAVEVGADAVHLVDEAHPRDLVLVGLTPHGLGLRLDAGDRVEHRDGTVEDAQRALDLDGEVDVAGGVDDVDAVVVPDARGGGRGDGDATLLLLRHVVHGRRAVVDLADLVALAGVVEDALGRRGLARVDVGHDADVAGALEWEFALSHLSTSLSGSCSQVASVRGGYAGPNLAIGTVFNDIGAVLALRGRQPGWADRRAELAGTCPGVASRVWSCPRRPWRRSSAAPTTWCGWAARRERSRSTPACLRGRCSPTASSPTRSTTAAHRAPIRPCGAP